MEAIGSLIESLVARRTCPVADEGVGPCRGRADTLITVASNLGVEAYLMVCEWHADLIEGV